MKTPSLLRIALLACAFAAAGMTVSFADDNPPPPPPPGAGMHGANLTPDEQAEFKKDRDQVFAANPDLQKEGDDLKAERQALSPDASADDKKALHEKMHAFNDKMKDAVLKIDPAAAPIFAKIEAAHHHGPPPGQ